MDHTNEIQPNYALNGKIMLCSATILFFVVFVIISYHSYARWCSSDSNRQHRPYRRRGQRTLSDSISPANNAGAAISQGLDPTILKTLPSFFYSSKSCQESVLECAVCLSEFEEEEQGRSLPKCDHAFHIECIDTWFQSHSNCPLCRAPVQPDVSVSVPPPETSSELMINVNEPGLSERQVGEGAESEMGLPGITFSPEWCRRKPAELVGISVEVPPREMESVEISSPESHLSRFSDNPMLSLKRIWRF
ncbi:hypothetical protein UlMin_031167 [Ulmus minor]